MCKALSEMKSFTGEHKTVVIQPEPADAKVPNPLKGAKGSKAKALWVVSSNSVCVLPQHRGISWTECQKAVQLWAIHFFGAREVGTDDKN